MIKYKLIVITLISFLTVLISCNISTDSNVNEEKSTIDNYNKHVGKTEVLQSRKTPPKQSGQGGLKGSTFLQNLKSGEKLSSFFNDNWIFIYHEDNRCDGSTDGQIDNLKSSQIDSTIKLQVLNDGEGWACDKKEPKTYNLDFDLMKKIKEWDRLEIPKANHQEKNIVYIIGAGESDFLILHYDDDNLIIKLEFRSEDPG